MKILLSLFVLTFFVACLGLSEDNSEASHPTELIDIRDGHVYKVVKIGKQVWMAENLALEIEGSSYCFENIQSNCDLYGKLYPWDIVVNGEKPTKVDPLAQHEVQGICPEGWRVPSMWDFKELGEFVAEDLGYVEGEYEKYEESVHAIYDIAYALKAVGQWLESTPRENKLYGPITSTDEYGFGALPGGYGVVSDSIYFYNPEAGRWWSSTERCDQTASYLSINGYDEYLHARGENIYWGKPLKGCGSDYWSAKSKLLSVRCLKN